MTRHSLSALLITALALSACSSLPSWMGGKEKEIDRLPGERTTALPMASALAPDDALKAMAFSLPPELENISWPQHTGFINSATSNLKFSGSFENLTSANIGDGESFEHPLVPRPVAADGMVFAMDAVGHISAHDAADIDTVRWESKGVVEEDEPDVMGGGLAYDQGKLYAVSGRGVVAAFDGATGKELWRKSTRTPFRSAPRVSDGRLYAVTIDSRLFAMDAASGEILWAHRGIGETAGMMNSVSPAVSGGDVIVPYASGEIFALSTRDGAPLWGESLAAGSRMVASAIFAGIGGDPVVDGEVVFAVSSGGKLAVFALNNGQNVWALPVSSINTPWVTGDYLYVLSTDNTLTCFIKYSGRVRWSMKLPSYENEQKRLDPIVWRGPIMVGGKLAVFGSNEELKLISAADGTIVDTKEIPEEIATDPIVAGGRIYFVGTNAKLYSLQ